MDAVVREERVMRELVGRLREEFVKLVAKLRLADLPHLPPLLQPTTP